MSDKAKKGLKLAGYAAVILLTAFILYHLFKDSYKYVKMYCSVVYGYIF